MGANSIVRIGNIILYTVNRDFDPAVMILFTKAEERLYPYSPDLDHDDFHRMIADDLEGEPFIVVMFAINLQAARDRLEFMGFTLSQVKEEFIQGVEKRLFELAERKKHPTWVSNKTMVSTIDNEIEALEQLTFETWLNGFRTIVNENLKQSRSYLYPEKKKNTENFPLTLGYMLSGLNDFFGFPTYDFRNFLRAAIEGLGASQEAELIYDLTELITSEYYSINTNFITLAQRDLVENLEGNYRTIILTEGSTDKWVLENSLKLLYPHLHNYYSFMDFENTRVPGGASTLVSTLKSFIGAGIANRIIALFDNDTAALSAMQLLKSIRIPENVRVIRYPDISIASNYPTIGPQGITEMNVNGLAGSIELYFGCDILEDENGKLTPVQWRGYDDKLRQYQGEIINKTEIQSKFRLKLDNCLNKRADVEIYDWGDIQAILDVIRTAFNDG